jgi:hypothetical protein
MSACKERGSYFFLNKICNKRKTVVFIVNLGVALQLLIQFGLELRTRNVLVPFQLARGYCLLCMM